MGPDEHVSREEMTAFAEYVLAKLAQLGKTIVILTETLASDHQAVALVGRVARDPATRREQAAMAALEEFEEIHKIARRYLDHLQE